MNQLLIVIVGLLFFMVMTGTVIPSLISTDKLSLMGILLIVASLAFTISAIVSYGLRKMNPPKKGRKR
jgi:hypothetical protein